jgi:hypothetical protein
MKQKARLPWPPKFKLLKPKVPRGARASSASGDATADDTVYRAPTSSVDDQDAGDTSSPQDNYRKGGLVKSRAPADVAGDMGGSPGLAQGRKPYRR